MLRAMQFFVFGSAAVATTAYTCCFVVRPGEAAVLFNRFTGLRDGVYTEGLRFRVPGVEDPKFYNVRLSPRELTTTTGTKDMQKVNIRLRVLFRPVEEKLPEIYRTYGLDYDERILPSVSNESLKAVIAEYKAEELIQKRGDVSQRLQAMMRERVKDFHVVLEDISLVDLQFTKEFMTAVEQKQVAQQEAERFKFVVQENEQRKKATIIRAEGESTAAKLISDAMGQSGPGFVELRRIEASRDIAHTLARAPNVSFVPQNVTMLLRPMQGAGAAM
jgi:prohibitin 1